MTEKIVKINMSFLCSKKFFMLHQIYFMEYPPIKIDIEYHFYTNDTPYLSKIQCVRYCSTIIIKVLRRSLTPVYNAINVGYRAYNLHILRSILIFFPSKAPGCIRQRQLVPTVDGSFILAVSSNSKISCIWNITVSAMLAYAARNIAFGICETRLI